MHKALVAAVLGSLLLVVSPAPAYAHADLVRSVPANGSVIAKAPASIRLTFSEPVSLDAAHIMDAAGREVPARATLAGAVLTLIPSTPLAAGITTASFTITSDDGHQVDGATSFIIGAPPAHGPAEVVTTIPAVRTQLSGSHPGRLVATFTNSATSGEVIWSSPTLTGTLTWPVHAQGKRSQAAGVLPFAGQWSMRATLITAKGALVITSGTATLTP